MRRCHGALAAAAEDKSEFASQVAQLQDTIRQKDLAQEAYRRQIASLKKQLGTAAPPDAAVVAGDWIREPKVLGLAGVGILVVGALAWAALAARKRQRGSPAVGEQGQEMNPASVPEENSQARQTAIR